MIRKLRWKFIGMALLSILVTLLVLMTCINGMNYKKVVDSADVILETLKENNGYFPEDQQTEDYNGYSKETPFESRYFYVNMDSDGYVLTANIDQIHAIGLRRVIQYAQKVYTESNTHGFISDYRFIKCEENGVTQMIFLDCSKALSNFRYFLYTSIGICLIGFFLVSLLIYIFSYRIIQPVAQSYEKQKRFITDAGHEIKTPLATISADLTVLEMDGIQNEWTKDIAYQTKRLTQLTNELIYLSKMEEEDQTLDMVDFPISDIVLETATSFEARAKAEKKTYKVDVEPGLSYYGNAKHTEQLVSILLDNALKYSEREGSISLSLHKVNKKIELVVYNTTPNIKRENIEHLFDRFYRPDASHNSQTGGYGIGLSIAQAIVQASKGKITASTEDEKSMTVRALL